MKTTTALLLGALCVAVTASAATPEEAAKLKSELTPLGAEKAGNKDGAIPAWTGGYTTPIPGDKAGGRRGDPFASEKPVLTITAKNMDQYAAKLTDGVKAMLKKYPDTYKLEVYKTARTAAAPQWVYDNTFKNATQAKTLKGGDAVEGAYGGIPFPLPKTGAEVMWNGLLYWRGASWNFHVNQYLITASGGHVLSTEGVAEQQSPYYLKDVNPAKWGGEYWMIRLVNTGPPIRAGEAVVGRENVDPDKTLSWVYLTGQRRVRKLPNACCDTPTPATAGVMSFDELEVWTGRLDRFDWKIVGKQEMYIPYNSNLTLQPKKDTEVLIPGQHHLASDKVRWELHRVWVVESSLKPGKRHQAPKGRYYVDEDTWMPVLGDRWDANNQLWKTLWRIPAVMPDLPATVGLTFGYYDLLSGAGYVANLFNQMSAQYTLVPTYKDSVFTPDAMAGESVR